MKARTRAKTRARASCGRALGARAREGDARWTASRGDPIAGPNEGVGQSDEDEDEGSTVRARARERATGGVDVGVDGDGASERVGRVKTARRGGA